MFLNLKFDEMRLRNVKLNLDIAKLNFDVGCSDQPS